MLLPLLILMLRVDVVGGDVGDGDDEVRLVRRSLQCGELP